MQKKIVVISAAETFMVKGLIDKIRKQGYPATHCGVTPEEISEDAANADLLVYYTDGFDARSRSGLPKLKDLCVATGKELVLIGKKEEYELVAEVIPEEHIRDFYERPFEMAVFLEKIEEYLLDAMLEESKKVILVVDDDANYLNIIREWLKSTYLIARAQTSMQAIQWLAKNHADLVLLDYEMPITSGAKMLEMLRSEDTMRDIPVMFLTAKQDRERYLAVKDFKPVGYLLKTIDRAGLLKELRNFFAQQEGPKAANDDLF